MKKIRTNINILKYENFRKFNYLIGEVYWDVWDELHITTIHISVELDFHSSIIKKLDTYGKNNWDI